MKRSRRAPPMTSRCRASKRERKTVHEDERERGEADPVNATAPSRRHRHGSSSMSRAGVAAAVVAEATISVSCSALSLFLVPLLCAKVTAAVMVALGLLVLKESCYCCCSIPPFFSSFSKLSLF
ncbi:hypothetical protein AHAS_Ahas19G0192500 [Arachis hypogaea]